MEQRNNVKRNEIETYLSEKKLRDCDLQLSSIILDSFPDIFWRNLDSSNIFLVLKDYIRFIMSGSPYKVENGKIIHTPKVRVQNIRTKERQAHSLKRDSTIVEIHVLNQPFIYESVRNYFTKKGCRIFGSLHPIFSLVRKGNEVVKVSGSSGKLPELFLNISIEKITRDKELKKIEDDLRAIISCLTLSVDDFNGMKAKINKLAAEVRLIKTNPGECNAAEISDFLDWLANDNFVLIGIKEYLVNNSAKSISLKSDKNKTLGLFKDNNLPDKIIPGLIPEIEEILLKGNDIPHIFSTDFCRNGSSIIYQMPPAQFFSIRTNRGKAKTPVETVLLGRLTRGANNWKSDTIPILRKKAQAIVSGIGQGESSFEFREARALFNYILKQELFYSTVDQLKATIASIMSLQGDDEAGIYIRIDKRDRYAMVMVTIARNDNSLAVRTKIENLLSEALKRPIAEWQYSNTDSKTLLFYYFVSPGKEFRKSDHLRFEEDIRKIARGWDQQLYSILYRRYKSKATVIFEKYSTSLDSLYKNATSPDEALSDIEKLEELYRLKTLQLDFVASDKGKTCLKLYSLNELPLMEMLQTFANFGLYVTGEQAYHIKGTKKRDDSHIINYNLKGIPDKLSEITPVFFSAMAALSERKCENDSLNRLLILAGLSWRAVELVRTVKNYMLQINRLYNASSVVESIVKHAAAIEKMYEYFEVKFIPSDISRSKRKKELEFLGNNIEAELSKIDNFSDFQIVNTLFEIIKCATRTNFFLVPERGHISIKIDGKKLSLLVYPKPFAEIYIHSPLFEGVHLRGATVARGGIRWSDRIDDFRTEILGLMKTQMLKNGIIVPEGAKGGFILKKSDFESREEQFEYMKLQYKAYISGLLDLTDNYRNGKKVCTPDLVAYDDFDPYFVVAADKGTASLSDTANEISLNKGFWLGDAFASGGISGYNHKAMGITARGAWECIKRHFREEGKNIQEESINVIGIGDMAGDVFGNGMLLSRKIKLVGAFNHIHIFLDPDPDPESSFKERARLFKLPRSSWTDYNPELISEGGGVYFRSAKSIPVSDQMRRHLGTTKKSVDGEEMIKLLLKAGVDLLYNGGVGTYIKAKSEGSADVGDKANDNVRVNGCDVRARVLGEGGNLGITQLGRLEYAAGGGKCNTDAVDNSGGVDTSDHEVNIKIILDHLLQKSEISSIDDRNRLLDEMKEQVTSQVLRNNYLQSAAISMDLIRARENPEIYAFVIDEMERTLDLNRKEEFIPSSKEIEEELEKDAEVFTRPMLSVLMGYQKMSYYRLIKVPSVIGTFFAHRYLNEYFPERIRQDYEAFLEEHQLKDEIISSVITNKIINQAGISLLPSISATTEKPVSQIVKAYIIIEHLMNADAFRKDVHSMDNIISTDIQYEYLIEMENTILYALQWFITHQSEDRITFDFVSQYTKIIMKFQEDLWSSLKTICSKQKFSDLVEKTKQQTELNVPESLAKTYVTLPFMRDIMDIIRIKEDHHYNFEETARLYLKVRDFLNIDWLEEKFPTLKASDKWGKENISNLKHELRDCQNGIVISVLNFKRRGENLLEAFDNYLTEKTKYTQDYLLNLEELKEGEKVGIISFNVVVKKLSRLISPGEMEILGALEL